MSGDDLENVLGPQAEEMRRSLMEAHIEETLQRRLDDVESHLYAVHMNVHGRDIIDLLWAYEHSHTSDCQACKDYCDEFIGVIAVLLYQRLFGNIGL